MSLMVKVTRKRPGVKAKPAMTEPLWGKERTTQYLMFKKAACSNARRNQGRIITLRSGIILSLLQVNVIAQFSWVQGQPLLNPDGSAGPWEQFRVFENIVFKVKSTRPLHPVVVDFSEVWAYKSAILPNHFPLRIEIIICVIWALIQFEYCWIWRLYLFLLYSYSHWLILDGFR